MAAGKGEATGVAGGWLSDVPHCTGLEVHCILCSSPGLAFDAVLIEPYCGTILHAWALKEPSVVYMAWGC